MSDPTRTYIPAAGRDWLLPFYDPIQWLLGGNRVRASMLEAAAPKPGMQALDVGCGTGSLLLALKRRAPGVEVTGIDPDRLALGRVRRKLAAAGLEGRLDEGFADQLPYPDGAFDCVFSSFMFHHLDREVKEGMLREVRRVLGPDGTFQLADFGGEGHGQGLFARLIHSHEEFADNFSGTIPRLMKAAGFESVREVARRWTPFGRVTHYEAR